MSFQTSEDRILSYYEVGREAVARTRGRRTYGEHIMQEYANEIDEAYATVYQARTFALLYSKADLKRLLDMRRESDARRFGFAHIVRLCNIKNRQARLRMQRHCIEQGWTVTHLRQELKKSLKSAAN